MTDIYERMLKVLKNSPFTQVDVESIRMDSHLIADLGLSSLALAALICDFEEEFNIKISYGMAQEMVTVKDTCGIIEKISLKG